MNERIKKIFSVVIAILLVISSTACFIPSIQVKAAVLGSDDTAFEESKTLVELDGFLNKMPSGSEPFFCISKYKAGQTAAVEAGKNEGDIYNVADANVFFNDEQSQSSLDYYTGVSDWFYKKNVAYGGNMKFEDIAITAKSWGNGTRPYAPILKDFIDNTSNYYYDIIILSYYDVKPDIYIFFSQKPFDFSFFGDKVYVNYPEDLVFSFKVDTQNNGQNDVGSTITRYEMQTFTASSISIGSSSSLLYSTMPIYFAYSNKGYNGTDYSSVFGNYPNLGNAIHTGHANDDFVFDRRTLFDNFEFGELTVDTDPESVNYEGIWDLDIVPHGDIINGSLDVMYTPTKALSDAYGENVSVEYTFQLKMLNTDQINANIWKVEVCPLLSDYYNTTVLSYHISDDYVGTSKSNRNFVQNQYVTYSMSNILQDMDSDSGDDFYRASGVNKPITGYYRVRLFKDLSLIHGDTQSMPDIGIGSEPGVTCMLISVYAQAFYNDEPLTAISTATYNYLTGDVTRQHTCSTDNNNIEVTVDMGGGFTGGNLQELTNTTIRNMEKGGGVNSGGNSTSSGGNATASGGQGGSVVNNNNDEIDIKSNWQYFEESTESNTEYKGALQEIIEDYDDVVDFGIDPSSHDQFLMFVTSSPIWHEHPFDYILRGMGTLVIIGLFTAILRLFRR